MMNQNKLYYNKLYEDIQERVGYLSALVEKTEAALKESPSGTLKIRSRKNGVSYYNVTDKSEIYLPQKNIALIHGLAQKAYDKKVLRAAKAELLALKKMHEFYCAGTVVEEWYGKISPARQELVHPVLLTAFSLEILHTSMKRLRFSMGMYFIRTIAC